LDHHASGNSETSEGIQNGAIQDSAIQGTVGIPTAKNLHDSGLLGVKALGGVKTLDVEIDGSAAPVRPPLGAFVETEASQAKLKSPPGPLKSVAAASAQQFSGPKPMAASGPSGKAAAKVVSSARGTSAPSDTTPSEGTAPHEKNHVGKGMVEVTDRKLKKTIGASHAVSTSAEVGAAPETLAATQAKPTESKATDQRSAPPKAAPAKAEDKSAAKVAKVPGNRQGFKTLEYIVYPAHGVGQITAIEEQEVAGYKLELFVISFIKDKMILKVPTPKVAAVGMRKLAEAPVVKRALDTLTGRARVKRTMWSRRAQEYEAKINSGDLVAIAEVVRDLYRSDAQPEQSYSERQLYEAALDRIAREIAAVQKLTDQEALKLIDEQLQKSPRRAKTEEADEADTDEDGDGIVEAA
jgi:CarD family transcriptional regulator